MFKSLCRVNSCLGKAALRLVLGALLLLTFAAGCTPTNPYKDSLFFMNDQMLQKEVAVRQGEFDNARTAYENAKAANMRSTDLAVYADRLDQAKTRLKTSLDEQYRRGQIKKPTWAHPGLENKEYSN